MDADTYSLADDIQIQCLEVGNEKEPLLIVDSFIKGAQALKDYAVGINQFPVADSFYPGIRMPVPMLYSVAMAKNLAYFIEGLFGLDVKQISSGVSRFSIVTTPPDQLGLFQRIPHIDSPSKNGLAALHYLVDYPNAGTALYRHRETGFEYVDVPRNDIFLQHVHQRFSEPTNYPKGYICGETPEFEVIAAVEAKFNRMIMYRGSSLHSGIIPADYSFDPSPATGRLTIASFFEFRR
jgi:hypothetical protein